MNPVISRWLLAGSALGLLAPSGCGGGSSASEAVKTVAVSGVVTYRGQPVEGATVTFLPGTGVTDQNAKAAFGVTDAQGRYSLTTAQANDGAVPGNYLVTISKQMAVGRQPDPADEEKDYIPPEPDGSESSFKAPDPVTLLPPKFATPTTSGLTATVTDDGGQTIDFALTD